jgi:hypothetical protein
VFLYAPILDAAANAPDGLLHRLGIAQDEHPVEIAQTLQTILVTVQAAWNLWDGSHVIHPQDGVEVRGQRPFCSWEVLLRNRGCWCMSPIGSA